MKAVLTSLMSITGMSSSSSYSDSSSELLSSSDELDSVGVGGDLMDVKLLSSRKLFILSVNGFTLWLNAFSLLNDGFVSFGGRIFLVEGRAGVNEPKRKVNNEELDKARIIHLRDRSKPGTRFFPLRDFLG
jgi:hypothetical protein